MGTWRKRSVLDKDPRCGERLVVEFMRGDGRVGRVEGEGVRPGLAMEGLGMGDAQ